MSLSLTVSCAWSVEFHVKHVSRKLPLAQDQSALIRWKGYGVGSEHELNAFHLFFFLFATEMGLK